MILWSLGWHWHVSGCLWSSHCSQGSSRPLWRKEIKLNKCVVSWWIYALLIRENNAGSEISDLRRNSACVTWLRSEDPPQVPVFRVTQALQSWLAELSIRRTPPGDGSLWSGVPSAGDTHICMTMTCGNTTLAVSHGPHQLLPFLICPFLFIV